MWFLLAGKLQEVTTDLLINDSFSQKGGSFCEKDSGLLSKEKYFTMIKDERHLHSYVKKQRSAIKDNVSQSILL